MEAIALVLDLFTYAVLVAVFIGGTLALRLN